MPRLERLSEAEQKKEDALFYVINDETNHIRPLDETELALLRGLKAGTADKVQNLFSRSD